MSEAPTAQPQASGAPSLKREQNSWDRHLLAWVVLALAFVGYVGLGHGNARVWRFGRMYIDSMPVRSIWRTWLDDLPSMPGQSFWNILIFFSVMFMLLWSLVGLAMLLMPSRFEQFSETDDTLQAVTAPAFDEAPVVESDALVHNEPVDSRDGVITHAK